MYRHILITLDNGPVDNAVVKHIQPLARLAGARLTLIHVADGFMARNQANLGESLEMQQDRAYLEGRQQEMTKEGFAVTAVLACGDPVKEILAFAQSNQVDLIAMAGHGHRFLADLILGSVSSELRHKSTIPILMVPTTASTA